MILQLYLPFSVLRVCGLTQTSGRLRNERRWRPDTWTVADGQVKESSVAETRASGPVTKLVFTRNNNQVSSDNIRCSGPLPLQSAILSPSNRRPRRNVKQLHYVTVTRLQMTKGWRRHNGRQTDLPVAENADG